MNACADERNDMMAVRKYCMDFIRRTTDDLISFNDIWESSTKYYITQGDAREIDNLNTISVDVWTLRAFVELAQDSLLASGVEAGIALEQNVRPVVYSDALKRFPDPVNKLVAKILTEYESLSNPELKAAGAKMTPFLKDLVAAFGDWPGQFLRQHLADEPYGTGTLQKDVVDLAVLLDTANTEAGHYLKWVSDTGRAASVKGESDFYSVLLQTQKTVISLSILSMDVYMLIVAKQRIKESGKTNLSENDDKLVSYYLQGRMKRYEDLLSFLEKRCGMVSSDEKSPCVAVNGLFHNVYGRLIKFSY